MPCTDTSTRVLDKIKKCLALASSDNPHEAAAALRQAHALMARHGVSAEAITLSDIGEATLPSCTMARNKPAHWEAALVAVVGSAFGCKLMVSTLVPKDAGPRMGRQGRVVNKGGFILVGLQAQVEIAAYTAQVLVRRCKRARAAFIAEQLAGVSQLRGGKALATRLGNEFALGWVGQIGRLVQEFAHSGEVDSAIERYMQAKASGTDTGEDLVRRSARQDDAPTLLARASGMRAAQGERLHRPMPGAAQQGLLERA